MQFPDWGQVPFKLPSVHRLQQYIAAMTLSEAEVLVKESIFRECVCDETLAFHSPDIPAGIVSSIVDLIFLLSGVTGDTIQYTSGLFDTYRLEATRNINFMKRIICSTFSGYTFDKLDTMDYQDIVQVFIEAEQILLRYQMETTPFSFTLPEEDKPKKPLHLSSIPGMPPPVPAQGQEVRKAVDIDALIKQDMKDFNKVDSLPVPANIQKPRGKPVQGRRR